MFLSGQGRYHEAVLQVQMGLNQVNQEREPRLFLNGRGILIRALSSAGNLEEAWRLLKESRPLYRELKDRILLARLEGIEGTVAKDLGRLAEAETILWETREVFLENQLGADVFCVSMSLADVYIKSGQWQQVRKILDEVIPLGEAIGLHQDVLMARLLYEQASRR